MIDRPVPLTHDDLAELRRMVARRYCTPSQAAALFGLDRQAVEELTDPRTRTRAPRLDRPGSTAQQPGTRGPGLNTRHP